jgi:hypothetical protein
MYDTLQLPADTGLTMLVYTAEPSARPRTQKLLASWAATNNVDAVTSASQRT